MSSENIQDGAGHFERGSKLGRAFYRNLLSFLETEARTALTFARLARGSKDADRKARNIGNAYTGYETILEFRGRFNLAEGDARRLNEALTRIRSVLQELGALP